MNDIYRLPLIPLRNKIILPDTTMNFEVRRVKSISALETAISSDDKLLFVAMQKSSEIDRPADNDIYDVGTVVRVIDTLIMPDDNDYSSKKIIKVIAEGMFRAKKVSYEIDNEDLVQSNFAIVERYPYTEKEPEVSDVVMDYVRENGEILFSNASDEYPREIASAALDKKRDSSSSLNTLSQILSSVNKQEFLELTDLRERGEFIAAKILDEIEILKVKKSVERNINEKMQNSQREYILREQQRAIAQELGDEDDELTELRERINGLNADESVINKLNKETDKMLRMPPSAPEYGILRNYLDWALELPWNNLSEDNEDLSEVRRILDEDHYGLDKVKERIIEYLAVRILTKGENKGPILCLVGPPGVGKTSVAKSIARALNKEYIQMSLGGIHDEAEIRGHRKTYVGAMAGRIMAGLAKAKTNNPLFLLDEIDKLTSDLKGDPSSALLEVLDPQQNNAFRDNYLEIPYDLSKVMFITTANTLSTIQQPLLDRMEVIEMSGYTEYEKLAIAKKYLVAKQSAACGIDNAEFTDNGIIEIVGGYTRESGVRNLEREIGSICRKIAKNVVETGKKSTVKITAKNVSKYLGTRKYSQNENYNEVGTCTGLAWTSAGGDTLTIEVGIVDGKGELLLTGQLGDVMKESARTAMTLVKSRAKVYGIEQDFFDKHDIHIHVPEGAVPKDGPSAGITLTTAIMSAVTGKKVRDNLAMTGEVTLIGKVLPIGGLKEKSLAAHRMGIDTVIIPEGNRKDVADLPDVIRKDIKFVSVNNIDSVFHTSFGGCV